MDCCLEWRLEQLRFPPIFPVHVTWNIATLGHELIVGVENGGSAAAEDHSFRIAR